jgi:hypothetical protein
MRSCSPGAQINRLLKHALDSLQLRSAAAQQRRSAEIRRISSLRF